MTDALWKKTKEHVEQGLNILKALQAKVEKMLEKMSSNDSCLPTLRLGLD